MGGEGSGRKKKTPASLATGGGDRPKKPTWLADEASEFWDDVVEELIRIGVAKKLDGPALAMLATWFQRWTKLARDPDSATAELQKATKEFDNLARRFGLNPTDRKLNGISPGGSKGDDDDSVDPLVAMLKAREKT